MKKISYYKPDGVFNGVHMDADPSDAVHASKTLAGKVVRIADGLECRYFLGGYEIRRNDVFALDSWGQKPEPRAKMNHYKSDRVFVWKGATWMRSKARKQHNCTLTGSSIPKGGTMYRTEAQGLAVSRWRLSVIPQGSVML